MQLRRFRGTPADGPHRLARIAGFFRWLAKENHILANPASELELPKLERRLPAMTLTAEEVEAVMAVPDLTDPIGLRDRAILEVFYATAIRRTELTRIGLYDVDYARQVIMVRQGKGKKDRVVPLGERARAWLEAWRDQARPQLVAGRDPGLLFLSAAGTPMARRRSSPTGSAATSSARASASRAPATSCATRRRR